MDCSPIEVGGLGIRRIGNFNQALLGKDWHFGQEVNHLWCQVIATKYGEDIGVGVHENGRGTHGYGLWRSIEQVGLISLCVWFMRWEKVIVFCFGMILGVGIFL